MAISASRGFPCLATGKKQERTVVDHQCPMGCLSPPASPGGITMAGLSVPQGKLCVIKGAPEPAGRSSPNGWLCWEGVMEVRPSFGQCTLSLAGSWRRFLLWECCVHALLTEDGGSGFLPPVSPVCSGRGVCVWGVHVHPAPHRTAPAPPGSIPVQEIRKHHVLQLSNSH